MLFYNFFVLILLTNIFLNQCKGEIKKFIPSKDKENYFIQIKDLCLKQKSLIASDENELEEKINSILSGEKYFTYLNIIDKKVTAIISFYFFSPHEFTKKICYDNHKKNIKSQTNDDRIHIPVFCLAKKYISKKDTINFLTEVINIVSKETGKYEYYFGIFKKNETFQKFLLSNNFNGLTINPEEKNYCQTCKEIKMNYEEHSPFEYFSVSLKK